MTKRAISSIRNLGPASERAFAAAGIHTAQEVRALGADAAYRRLLESGAQAHFIGYHALAMGLQGRPWNDCRGAEKAALRERFDAICRQIEDAPASAALIDRKLDEIGVIRRKKR
ncbi:MAG: TfoX/Sxy family protein [Paracoccaceae bacterium]